MYLHMHRYNTCLAGTMTRKFTAEEIFSAVSFANNSYLRFVGVNTKICALVGWFSWYSRCGCFILTHWQMLQLSSLMETWGRGLVLRVRDMAPQWQLPVYIFSVSGLTLGSSSGKAGRLSSVSEHCCWFALRLYQYFWDNHFHRKGLYFLCFEDNTVPNWDFNSPGLGMASRNTGQVSKTKEREIIDIDQYLRDSSDNS